MVRLANVGFRLQKAAGDVCVREGATTGLLIDQIGAYAPGDRELVMTTLHMSQLPQVAGVPPESAAAKAGVEPGDDIVSVAGKTAQEFIDEDNKHGVVADAIENYLYSLPADKPIKLQVLRGGKQMTFEIHPEQLCRSRFILKTDSGLSAFSDGKDVAIGWKLIMFTQNDSELALIVGHELAHVAFDDEEASGLKDRRAKEDRADLLGAAMAQCAGYNVQKGLAFWDRYNRQDMLRWFRNPSHRNVRSRVKLIAASIAVPHSCPPDRALFVNK
ncbi:M48 family metallopeptidase [Sphingomonas sp. HH69]